MSGCWTDVKQRAKSGQSIGNVTKACSTWRTSRGKIEKLKKLEEALPRLKECDLDRIDWDDTDGRNGGAQRTVWEILMEMERFKNRAGGGDLGAVALVLDLAKAFERVGFPVFWAWAAHFSFARKMLLLRAPEASAVQRMCGGAAPDHHGYLARIQVELRAPTCCVAGRTGLQESTPR